MKVAVLLELLVLGIGALVVKEALANPTKGGPGTGAAPTAQPGQREGTTAAPAARPDQRPATAAVPISRPGVSRTEYRYVNRCWQCHRTVDSISEERCEACGWLICSACGSCEPGCRHGIAHRRHRAEARRPAPTVAVDRTWQPPPPPPNWQGLADPETPLEAYMLECAKEAGSLFENLTPMALELKARSLPSGRARLAGYALHIPVARAAFDAAWDYFQIARVLEDLREFELARAAYKIAAAKGVDEAARCLQRLEAPDA